MRLGDRLGVATETASHEYYACLLVFVGCTAGAETATEIPTRTMGRAVSCGTLRLYLVQAAVSLRADDLAATKERYRAPEWCRYKAGWPGRRCPLR